MRVSHIWHLGIKELYSLWRDPILLVFIIYSFTLMIYAAATAMPETLNRAPIAIVNQDNSPLSFRLMDAFYPPYFKEPELIDIAEMDARMDAGVDTFALHIPSGFQRDVLAGRTPELQLNIDATRMGQAFTGGGYVNAIIHQELTTFMREKGVQTSPVELTLRARFNPELNQSWFGGLMKIIDNITMLSLVLTGAALLRERERGTMEHLLAMPVTPFEIMAAKVWSMGTLILVASGLSLQFVVRGILDVPIDGSIGLFLTGAALHLFASTSMGIFLGTVSRSMPQFGLLLMMVLLPLQILSGGMTPQESMPDAVRVIMSITPNPHFVNLAQAVLYRGAGFSIIWPQLVTLLVIGFILFTLSLSRFRKSLSTMG